MHADRNAGAPTVTTTARIKRLRARADAARHFPVNTCPASRHAELIADMLLRGYPHATEDPIHCGASIMATVAALWETRTELAQVRARVAELEAGRP